LCMAWSGQCLTSEALSDRSANRGQCSQACRMPYELIVDGERRELGDVRYLLSPQDLDAHAVLGELMDAGVCSFKIEGRYKNVAYVSTTVDALREARAAFGVSPSEEARRTLERKAQLTQLTFSRGGMWGALATIAVAVPMLFRNPAARRYFIGSALIVVPLLHFVLLPLVDNYSAGMAMNRVQETDLTGRDRIALADLEAFAEHPVLGVGPGQSKYYHVRTFRLSSAHTEYSRVLAEHGSLGLIALVLLGLETVRRVLRRGTPLQRALVTSFTIWPLLYMAHSAVRLSVPALLFGIAAAWLLPEDDPRPASLRSQPS